MENLIIRGTTKCNCGHEFTLKDITTIKDIKEHGFYGGVVKDYSECKCPNCSRETILLLVQKGQTWEILNTAVRKSEQNPTETTTIENGEEKNINEEFICPECKKVCKNKIGLTAHLRTHQN